MSSDTTSPDTTRSAAEIRQDIVDYVLKQTDELSDVPGVKEFVDEHGRLTKEIAEAKARQERLAKAKEEYQPLERRVGSCRLALNDAETELAKRYAPLGDAAFKALLADDIDEQPLFADRLAAHKRVQMLQAECDVLVPGADAGMVQKTKAKAKQLAIKGKTKLEERKFGGLQAEIGRKIVEDELDDSIQCDPTKQLLSQIKDQRDVIASLSAELKEAESELAESGKRLSETVGLASIGRSTELDRAIKLGAKNIKQHDSDVAAATRGLVDTLKEVDASTLPQTLVPLLEGFAGRTNGFSFASAKEYWSGLSGRKRNQIVGGVAVAVILLGVFFFRGGDTPSTTNGVSGDRQTVETAAEPIVNSIGMKLALIPAGEFQMGSPHSEPNRNDNEARHLVEISKPFYLGVYEVTQQQYEQVMGARPWEGKPNVKEGPDYPAVYVSHDDAVAFCHKLSEKEGVEYRLPTEAEWEYACRAGTATAYSFGDDESKLGQHAWYGKNAWDIGENYAHRVGRKLPNPWGLYDIHGNVNEWCQDWHGPYGSEKVVSDPMGPAQGERGSSYLAKTRLLRGGAFGVRPSMCRSAYRKSFRPDLRLFSFGFRVARTYNVSP